MCALCDAEVVLITHTHLIPDLQYALLFSGIIFFSLKTIKSVKCFILT